MKNCRRLAMLLILAFIAVFFSTTTAQVEKKIIVKKKGVKYTLGIAITDVGQDVLKKHKLSGGALIKKVIAGSEAEKIGLQKDDIIVNFDGKAVKNAAQFHDTISEIKEEKTVDIVIQRNEEKKSLKATLKETKPEVSWEDADDEDFEIDIYEPGADHKKIVIKKGEPLGLAKGGFLGVQTINLNQELLEYFEVKHGVLVKLVVKDSPAEKADLKAGDVITEISGKKIEDFEDLIRIMNYYDPGDKVKVEFSRKGKRKSVDIVLDEKQKHVQVFEESIEKEPDAEGLFQWKSDDGKIHKKIKIREGAPHKDLHDLDIDVKDIDIEIYMI